MRKLSASRFLPIFYFLGIDFCKLWKDNDHYLFFMAQPFFRLSFDWIFSCTARASVFYLQKFIKRFCNTNSEHPIDSILPTFCQNIYLHLLNVRLPLYALLSNLPSPLWSSTDIHHRSRQVIDKRRLSKSCGFSTKSQTCALPKQLNSPECKIFYFGIKMMFCTRLIFFSLVWGKLRDKKKTFLSFAKKRHRPIYISTSLITVLITQGKADWRIFLSYWLWPAITLIILKQLQFVSPGNSL